MKIRPKKWTEFQHYKDRDPPWIKLHFKLVDDVTFQRLPRASQALAPMLWLLASKHPEGVIDANPEDLSFRLRWPEPELSDALSPLIGKGFFEVVQFDSAVLAPCKHDATPETYKPETEAERENPLVPLARDGGRALKAKQHEQALQVLKFLNARAGRHYRPVVANLKFIEARLAEGVTVQDLKTLTARKCVEWLGTDMAKFLRPETLFNATKCQSYLGEIPPEEPGGQPCNVPSAIEASRPERDPALADGSPQKPPPRGESSPTPIGDAALGSLSAIVAASSLAH